MGRLFRQGRGQGLGRYDRLCYRVDDKKLVRQENDAVGVAVGVDEDLYVVTIDDPGPRTLAQISEEIVSKAEQVRRGDPGHEKSGRAISRLQTWAGPTWRRSRPSSIRPRQRSSRSARSSHRWWLVMDDCRSATGLTGVVRRPSGGKRGVRRRVLKCGGRRTGKGTSIAMIKQLTEGLVARIVEGNYERSFLSGLYKRMLLIREFEEQVKFLFLEGSMPGTIHQCQGQEATAVGVCAALNADDWITSTHRPHGHALAKGLTPGGNADRLFGGVTGCCKGKGGSLHIGNIEKGMVPAIAIVGGGIPVAAGIGLAFKMQKSDRVVGCFFGDGSQCGRSLPRGRQLGRDLGSAGDLRLREQPLWGFHARGPNHSFAAYRRPGGRVWHSGRAGLWERRVGGLRGHPQSGRGVPRRPGPGAAGTDDLPHHRPLAT